MWKTLKAGAHSAHNLAAWNSGVATRYLELYRLLKLFPDASWKQYVSNSLQSVDWPSVNLKPASIRIGDLAKFRIVPHLYEFDFAGHLCQRLRHEPEVVDWVRGRTYDVVLEIGANVGVYTLLFSKLWPAAQVFSFEPSRIAYARLLENLALNSCQNVVPFNCAVSCEAGFLDFHEPEGHLTNGSLDYDFAKIFSASVKSTKVASTSGAQIQRLIPNGKRVLLKIDVEGAEPIVLDSMKSLIESERPDIILEVLPTSVNALNKIDWLHTYEFHELADEGPRVRSSFVAGNGRDFALVPALRASGI